jgi:hypothetical protein
MPDGLTSPEIRPSRQVLRRVVLRRAEEFLRVVTDNVKEKGGRSEVLPRAERRRRARLLAKRNLILLREATA